MGITLAAIVLVPEAILAEQGRKALYLLSGTTFRSVAYGTSFLAVSSSVIFAFVAYPLIVLLHLRSQLKDREVRHALKVIALCFGAISTFILAFNALASLGYSVLGIMHVASVGLLIAVVRAFTQPTFLKAFLGVVPALEPIPTSKPQDHLILIYGRQDEKFGPISRYISESVNKPVRTVYFYREDESLVRESLSRNGLNPRQHVLKGNLRLSPLTSLYQGDNINDEEAAIATCDELVSEARAVGKEGLRIVIDYGDQTRRPTRNFVEHLTDKRWTAADGYVKVLMTFERAAFQGEGLTLGLLKSKVQVLDFSESMEMFSRTVGLSHQDIRGKKILFEYDPLSDYERVVNSLLAESTSNFERAVVFTRKESPLHSIIAEQPGLKTFVLTTRVSYPKVEKENQVLLPVFDSSLLLDAFSRTTEAYGDAPFTIIFDSISHYVHTLGLDRTYSLVRQALELMVSDKVTAVFLLNAGAHDQKSVSTFESLFDMELVCRQDARVPEVLKRLSVSN